jgi:hypothetical protein
MPFRRHAIRKVALVPPGCSWASRHLPVLPGPVNVITQALGNSRRTSLSSGPRPTKLVSSTRRFPRVGCVTAVVMTQPNLKGRTTSRCPSGSSVPVPKRPRTPRSPKGLLLPARSVDAEPEALNATPPRRAGHRAHPPDIPRPGPTAATGPGRFYRAQPQIDAYLRAVGMAAGHSGGESWLTCPGQFTTAPTTRTT